MKQGLLVAFGGQLDTLADFGLTARAKHVTTPEEKLAATDKAKATREARHTMGSKQRAAIKGVVPATPTEAGSAGGSEATADPTPGTIMPSGSVAPTESA